MIHHHPFKWEVGDFSKLIKNTVNYHNLTDYTSLSEKPTILTPAIFFIKKRFGAKPQLKPYLRNFPGWVVKILATLCSILSYLFFNSSRESKIIFADWK